ncbi:hypothetical protein BKA64DRAFT_657977 [Cadophora sp. MPI-SDFR-AT-0126]|nr:hypothetical protein BKA64DRAFT_657977 [Leotiomycetes sp. MPI-SDFR-AT-0126]
MEIIAPQELQIAQRYHECIKLLQRVSLDDEDLQCWATEFDVAKGSLDRKLRRSRSLRQLLVSRLETLEHAIFDGYIRGDPVPDQRLIEAEGKLRVNEQVGAKIYDVLCLSTELRNPLPSDNIGLLSDVKIKNDAASDIELASTILEGAADSLKRRIGIIFWMRKKEIVKLHEVKIGTIRKHAGDLDEGHYHMDVIELARSFVSRFDHCPLCVKPDARLRRYGNKDHLLEDLEPYVCTFGNCSQAYQMFTRDDWEEHEKTFHKVHTKWVCRLCHEVSNTRQDFLNHVNSSHPRYVGGKNSDDSDSQSDDNDQQSQSFSATELAQLSEQRSSLEMDIGNCPFCDHRHIPELTKHVASHLESVFLQMLQESRLIDRFITSIQTSSFPDLDQITRFGQRAAQRAERPKVDFYGSWTGDLGLPSDISTSPFELVWNDIKMSVVRIWRFPGSILPIPNHGLDPYHECYPIAANLICFVAHFILFLNQIIILASLSFLLFLPAWFIVIMLLLVNHSVSKTLNGNTSLITSSTLVVELPTVGINSEKWFFINGSLAGKHWLRLNIDRLTAVFGRPITGIHNTTHGIIFGLINTLIQRHLGYVTASTRECYKALRSELQSPHTGNIVLILHGQGAIIGSRALDLLLQELPHQLFSKLEIYTFGSTATHFNNPYRDAPSGASHATTRTRVLGHIEHYVLSQDIASAMDPFRSGLSTERTDSMATSSATTNPNFAGQIFAIEGSGCLFNGDYMNTIFPSSKPGQLHEASAVMETIAVIQKNPQRESPQLADPDSDLESESIFSGSAKPKGRSLDTRSIAVGMLKVKDLSRLWQYRDGRSPPPRGGESPRMATI